MSVELECVDLFDAEVAALNVLHHHCQEAFESDGFSDLQRQDYVAALSAALEADRLAIGHIGKALDLIGDYEVPKALRPGNPGRGEIE